MTERIEDLLLKIGITPNLNGFRYLCDILEMFVEKPNAKIALLYEAVAKKYELKSGKQVEKGIQRALSHADLTIFGDVFKKSFPTNNQFICTVALLIRRGDIFGKQNWDIWFYC